jgi:cellulose synthase/poly-beta-1,6-N-acetylglucosamine synthase-like glycosyltransferase
LASLAAQTHEALNLWIWNNNPALCKFVDKAVSDISDFNVDVVHSTRNVGGFGRFYIARRLAEQHAYVIFLDDDQVPAPDFLSALLGEFAPKTVKGAWAFHFRGTRSYWDRVAAAPGERVKFCGGGGMISDAKIFLEPGLFRCPRRFWFVEDLWLSYYADRMMGWSLFKSGAGVVKEPDDLGQYLSLGATKDLMFRYLVRQGWNPLLPESGVFAHGNDVKGIRQQP